MAVETLKCLACSVTWEREKIGGAKPRWCPDCKTVEKKRLQREASSRWYESGGREYQREYQRANSERCYASTKKWTQANPERMRKIRQEYAYGRTIIELDALRATGTCQICKTQDPGPGGWHIDHDHACCSGSKGCGNCIRALLCADCNTLLGRVELDKDRFFKILRFALSNPRVNWSSLEAKVLQDFTGD